MAHVTIYRHEWETEARRAELASWLRGLACRVEAGDPRLAVAVVSSSLEFEGPDPSVG